VPSGCTKKKSIKHVFRRLFSTLNRTGIFNPGSEVPWSFRAFYYKQFVRRARLNALCFIGLQDSVDEYQLSLLTLQHCQYQWFDVDTLQTHVNEHQDRKWYFT
jgi:hypothetical protein